MSQLEAKHCSQIYDLQLQVDELHNQNLNKDKELATLQEKLTNVLNLRLYAVWLLSCVNVIFKNDYLTLGSTKNLMLTPS